MKTCKKCKQEQPETNFHISTRNSGGLFPLCKDCSRERNRQRYLGNSTFCYDEKVKELKFWVEKQGVKFFKHDSNLVTI